MHLFRSDSLDELYIEAVEAVSARGVEITKRPVLPDGRIQRIKELFPVMLELHNPRNALLAVSGRTYNPAFLAAELIWNLVGDDAAWLTDYNKAYRGYFSPDGRLSAGYGRRILNFDGTVDQIQKVVNLLTRDPLSQHASISVFDPRYDLDSPPFVPCIVLLRFRIRSGRLDMLAFLRAQDIWLGFPYDVPLLVAIFSLVSHLLQCEMGVYYHFCDVLRLYEVHYDAAKGLGEPLSRGADRAIEFGPTMGSSKLWDKLRQYRAWIASEDLGYVDLLESEPLPWRDLLKMCAAYRLLQDGRNAPAVGTAHSAEGVLKQVFGQWLKEYHPSTYSEYWT